MSRKYNDPPLVEAYCDFQFIPRQQWDMTIPGVIYEKIKKDFPIKQQQVTFGVGLSPKNGGVEQKVHATQKMQFYDVAKTTLIQVGTDLLTVNHLKPYPTWDVFKPIILDNLKIYQEIAQPNGLKRMELRYVNKIHFEQEEVKLEDYFSYYPYFGPDLPQHHDSFLVRTEVPQENKQDRLIMTLGTLVPEKPELILFVLDLSYVMMFPAQMTLEQISNWIEHAHDVVEAIFEACITENSRILFREVK